MKKKRRKCDCWKYEHQVCDVCQRVDPKHPKPDAPEPHPTKALACVPDRFRVKQDTVQYLERGCGNGECK